MRTRDRERLVTVLGSLCAQLRAALDDERCAYAPGEVRAHLATAVSSVKDALLLCQFGRHGTLEWALYADVAVTDAEHALALYAAWQGGLEEART